MAARSIVGRFWRDERGATAIEYGLICALIFLAIVTGVTVFGNTTVETYDLIGDSIGAVL